MVEADWVDSGGFVGKISFTGLATVGNGRKFVAPGVILIQVALTMGDETRDKSMGLQPARIKAQTKIQTR